MKKTLIISTEMETSRTILNQYIEQEIKENEVKKIIEIGSSGANEFIEELQSKGIEYMAISNYSRVDDELFGSLSYTDVKVGEMLIRVESDLRTIGNLSLNDRREQNRIINIYGYNREKKLDTTDKKWIKASPGFIDNTHTTMLLSETKEESVDIEIKTYDETLTDLKQSVTVSINKLSDKEKSNNLFKSIDESESEIKISI